MKGKKIYIAGKITGFKMYKGRFESAEREVRAEGAIALNPAILPKGFTQDEYLKICFAMIDVCDGIYLLDNWTDSPGAKAEHVYAVKTGKKIYFEPDYQTRKENSEKRLRKAENNICTWLHDEVCCNNESDECADFPSQEVCEKCEHREV